MTELEKKYLNAKEAYYNQMPIMSDSEFDELEESLKQMKSEIISIVGAFDRRAKIKHPSHMGSMQKIQTNKITGEPPIEEFYKWFRESLPNDNMEVISSEFKLDGNAINLVYNPEGKLIHALSRGDGNYGRDYLSKLTNGVHCPFNIPEMIVYDMKVIEVRCEAVISKQLFKEKYYSQFSNERNYVAGILNSDESTKEQIDEIELIPVDIRLTKSDGAYEYIDIKSVYKLWGFNQYSKMLRYDVTYHLNDYICFYDIFTEYLTKRDLYEYRTDGIVFKLNTSFRSKLGETTHHPRWAIAVKFKPEDCITTVTGFEYEMGKTGEFTPVALLEPVELDGTIVRKASAYNAGFINKNKLNVGSKVSLVKSGDIIPQIVNVITPSIHPLDIENLNCPYCNSKLNIIDGKHIMCSNSECSGKKLMKFINGMKAFKIYGFGEVMMTEVFNEYINTFGIEPSPIDILSECKLNIPLFKNIGLENKNYEKISNEIKKINSVTLEQVIASCSFDGMSNDGKTICEVAKKITGIEYDFSGLEKSTVNGFENGQEKFNTVTNIINSLNKSGITVTYPEQKDNDLGIINICLTGSPKQFGYSTKKEYLQYLQKNGINVKETDVKKCDVLITDDINSSSSKTNVAKKLNKRIITYNDKI